ncbi:MAG: Cellulose biosynthesis protein BcsQ [Gaiellaceae bacterium]|nr:Cellulose biosynthesis protein BcsQ [Gaiellaceae bacterium]
MVAVDGGDVALRTAVAGALAPASDLALASAGDVDVVDVVIAADDAVSSALDRCRASRRPCVVLLDEPSIASVSDAMRAGARGAVAREPLDAFGLVGAVRDAAAFRLAKPDPAALGRLIVVTGATGGAGATTVALALARAAAAPVALLDLDLAGGDLARRTGIGVDPADAGLAGQASGRRAWERLAVDAGFAHVVPAPRRPDLAWLVREGVCADLARAARAACDTVVADIGRACGPPLELVADATMVVVVARPVAAQLAAAAAHAAFIDGLLAGRGAVRVCVTGMRLRDEGVIRLATAAHGLRIAARLPFRTPGQPVGSRPDRSLATLLAVAA